MRLIPIGLVYFLFNFLTNVLVQVLRAAKRAGAFARMQIMGTLLTTGLSVFVLWNLATLLGAVGAARLGDPASLGLDAAVPAAFLALLAPQVRARRPLAVAVAGALVALVAVPLTPPGVPARAVL